MRYLIELGRQSLLCASEFVSLLRQKSDVHRTEALAPHILLVETQFPLEPDFFFELGGTIRVAASVQPLSSLSPVEVQGYLHSAIESGLLDLGGEKVSFGLSVFPKEKRLKKIQGSIADICSTLKEDLRQNGLSSRYVEPQSGQTSLTSVQVGENRVLDTGFEIVLVEAEEEWLAGLTLWVQDYSGQTARDYDRPHADPRSGMLPPKLARMIVNLARGPNARTLLDPFCGSGGTLMEALLVGLSPTGMDRDFETVRAARANCEWLMERFNGSFPVPSFTQGDATEMHRYFDPLSFDAVATEPYLGPPLTHSPSPRRLKAVLADLHSLYRETLAEIRIVTRPGGRVVFITPCFCDSSGDVRHVSVHSTIQLAGYRVIDSLESIQHVERLRGSREEIRAARRGVLYYGRPDQHVTREIHLLQS